MGAVLDGPWDPLEFKDYYDYISSIFHSSTKCVTILKERNSLCLNIYLLKVLIFVFAQTLFNWKGNKSEKGCVEKWETDIR